ncbi:MAG: hypothetical protein JEZ09_21345 [Salinivirgaceae bacterium]|nr:hypothetical protein [Salinivirgaceae bacterium]
MIKLTIIKSITAMLILLWVYSTYSKLRRIKLFKEAMLSQAFPQWIGKIFFWILPLYELLLAFLLIFEKTRFIGMSLSFITMLLFTLYIAGAVFDLYTKYPCACGGIFRKMKWRTHLKVNLAYSILALIGVILILYP